MRISIGDIELWFDVAGSSLALVDDQLVERPTIIALHGGPGFDHSYFKPEISEGLADQAQVVFLDQRGQGRSDAGDPGGWTLDQWADDVAVFCQTLGIKKPVLMGHSFGGFVALAAAARHPELASGLIILASAAYTDREMTIGRFGELGGPDAAAAARDLFDSPDDDSIVSTFMQRCLPLYAGDPTLLFQKVGRMVARPETQTHFFKPTGEFGHFDYRPALANSRVPTLMLQGSLDPIIPPATAKATAASFPAGVAQFVLIDGASHDLTGERWADVCPIVQEFVKRLPRPDAST
jgi:pimeloyl-ACP methyl ester carboxylesterase